MKQRIKHEWPIYLVMVVYLVYQAMSYPALPDQVPTQWGMNGQVSNYSSKGGFLLLIAMPIAFYFLMEGLRCIDPKRQNYDKFRRSYDAIRGIFALFLMGFVSLSTYLALHPDTQLPVGKVVEVLVGVLFIWLGNRLSTVKQNFFTGIKTPWALSSEENWNRTNRLAAILMMVGGVLFILCSLLGLSSVGFIIILAVCIIPTVYSYLLYRKGI